MYIGTDLSVTSSCIRKTSIVPPATFLASTPNLATPTASGNPVGITGFNASEGTLVFDVEDSAFTSSSGNPVIVTIGAGTSSTRFFIQKNGVRLRVFSSTGSERWEGYLTAFPIDGKHRVLIGYTATSVIVMWNGSELCKSDEAGYTFPASVDGVYLANLNSDSFDYTGGTFSNLRYWDTLLDSDQRRVVSRNKNILSSATGAEGKKMWLVVGQSNAVGRATGSPTYLNPSNIFTLGNDMAVRAYSDPYDADTDSVIGSLDDGISSEVGLAGFFADKLVDLTGDDVVVCPANLSGTSFDGTLPTWRIDSSLYRTSGSNLVGQGATATGFIQQALMAEQFSRIQGVLFIQGVADVTAQTSEADYETYYGQLIDEFRATIGRNVPWYDLQLPQSDPDFVTLQADYDAIINAKASVIASRPNCYTVTATDLPGQLGDEKHYTLASYKTLGERAALAVAS